MWHRGVGGKSALATHAPTHPFSQDSDGARACATRVRVGTSAGWSLCLIPLHSQLARAASLPFTARWARPKFLITTAGVGVPLPPAFPLRTPLLPFRLERDTRGWCRPRVARVVAKEEEALQGDSRVRVYYIPIRFQVRRKQLHQCRQRRHGDLYGRERG